ncbi:SH3 domain-containing protein [Aphanothece sacrum]|uniref:SH3b domain-containing protein n=1 Tax=Aphanothece sacrum FPU1 TaxID=1920663 RepID=A0A401IHH1_APHSA|nr:SH3 domain-containing protein [Aphanothece sacrum]GBF80718.1 hypothetical protein AsFPU1_2122 [Aphanothece sacrum FPU1]GBF83212.1 hypothetical protein AsFPU3_0251 [Aphanothece sacrum FPU3]
MNRLSSLFQFILGFFLGVILLVSGTTALAYVVLYRMSSTPPKPTFAEEKPKPKVTAKDESKTTPQVAKTPVQEVPKQEVAAKEPEPSPEVKEEETEKLPDGAYKATVNWSTGLSLRAEPGQEAERIGGVDYNTELIILSTSPDGNWQKVRVAGGSQEGWIKAGNVQKVE